MNVSLTQADLTLPEMAGAEAYLLLNEDSLKATKRIRSESVDLIYADPPFFTKRTFQIGKKIAFNDKWAGGLTQYLAWITPRLKELHRTLKPTGSMYLHCDPHASHYLKVAMDGIFGYRNFINEIVWKRQSAHSDGKQGARHFGRIHDTILFYAKCNKYVWTPQFRAYDEEYVNETYRYVEDGTNRRYALGDLTAPGGHSKRNASYTFMGVRRYWRYSQKHMEELVRDRRIELPRSGSLPRLKRYLDEMKGLPIQDLWVDNDWSVSREPSVYPTQKPERLLERVILSSSRSGDVVLDPFCGSGTSLIAATRFGRRCIGIDTSKSALQIAKYRLEKAVSLRAASSQILVQNLS